jgi:hypothetical protein
MMAMSVRRLVSSASLPAAAMPVLAFLLAGCGPSLEWTRPNTSLAQVQQDSAECTGLARDQAYRESFYYGSPFFGMPGPFHGGFGPFPYTGYRDDFMWRSQRESDLRDFCLRARGYALTAVQP